MMALTFSQPDDDLTVTPYTVPAAGGSEVFGGYEVAGTVWLDVGEDCVRWVPVDVVADFSRGGNCTSLQTDPGDISAADRDTLVDICREALF